MDARGSQEDARPGEGETIGAACREVLQGRIAESGTHEQLLSRGGLYAQLWSLQARTEPDADLPQDAGDSNPRLEAAPGVLRTR